ncbi:GntP family permease [Clostridium sp. HBUAS56010]|uniref:GntP family permease n=1 Tax=Clostridium sp. HBUAS56010 TaxID=2571127 RepID=UPI001177BEFC|nr:GntP family permease [Clostridium sp. HBUAS56010]
MNAEMQMVSGLILGMILLIFLVTKTKVHVFLAIIISAVIIGILGGMNLADVASAIPEGFGGTLKSIGIIIGFGVMLGKLLEDSKATKVMANALIRLLGKNKEEEAMGAAGFITSLSIFCTSGFIILAPLVKGLSKKTRKSVVALGIALAGGLVMSHSLVPPAAGPIGVAGILNANIGKMMLFGTLISIPSLIAVVIYARYMGKKIYQLPGENNTWIRPDSSAGTNIEEETSETELLPSAWKSFAPILTPILLILIHNVLVNTGTAQGLLGEITGFLGTPVIALAIGLLLAILLLTKTMTKAQTLSSMEEGLKSSGKLMLLVGGGGALGKIIQVSGLGDFVATAIAGTAIPAILLPFLISLLLRVIQGSGSVAMLTAASVISPMLGTLGLDPVFAGLAACTGSLFFSYFNDSYFWVINETLGIEDTKEQMKIWSVTSTICCITALISLLILNAFFG